MTLEQLRIFVAVAEREHVTRAAEYLNLTQSAVSHAVSVLEAEFQLQFFNRVGRHIELTEIGSVFLAEAYAVLARADAARTRLREMGALKTGTLHVHASQTIASYWLPARLNAYRARYPGIALKVTIANTREICDAIRSGTATLGLVEDTVADASLRVDIVAADQLLMVVNPAHPWAASPPTLDTLHRSAWVMREPGSGTRSAFEGAMARAGVEVARLPIWMELAANEAVASAVETGDAATVLSASVVAGRLEAGLLHHVPFALPDRAFLLVRHPERAPSPSEAAFCAEVIEAGPRV